jgi:hypothetical protein
MLSRDALSEFRICHESDPTHYQAERARDRLEQERSLLPQDQGAQVAARVCVVAVAVALLLLAQYTKFWGWTQVGEPEQYRLTDVTLAQIPPLLQIRAQQPEAFVAFVDKVRPAFDKPFADKEALLVHLHELVGMEWSGQYGETLAAYAFVPAGPRRRVCLCDGYWALMSLGAVLFLIAGLYLPYLTSLKAGPLQLEKRAAEQVGAGGALGITVERMAGGTRV